MIQPQELAQYTVKIYGPGGNGWGTGFWVAENLILTCAHVVRDAESVAVRWQGQSFRTAAIAEMFPDEDIALLQCADGNRPAENQPPIIELETLAPAVNADLIFFGYPDRDYENGRSQSPLFVGPTGDPKPYWMFKDAEVRPGYSGAPLLNCRTGRVCGMVKFAHDRQLKFLGGGAIPMATILERLPKLRPVGKPNPFGETRAIADPSKFLGRQELLRQIFEELGKGSSQALIGPPNSGKSSILQMIRALGPEQLGRSPEEFIHLDMNIIQNAEDFFEELCAELAIDPPCKASKLKRQLLRRQQRYVLCLDEIHALSNEAFFPEPTRNWLRGMAEMPNSPIQLVIASQRELRQLFPDRPNRSSPLADFFDGQTKLVDYLSEEQVLEFWQEGVASAFGAEQARRLWLESEKGNLRLLQRAAARLYEELTQT